MLQGGIVISSRAIRRAQGLSRAVARLAPLNQLVTGVHPGKNAPTGLTSWARLLMPSQAPGEPAA